MRVRITKRWWRKFNRALHMVPSAADEQRSDLILPGIVPLAEAAAFTCGCFVLRGDCFASERAGRLMLLTVAVLVIALLILAQPENALDPYAIDLDGMRPLLD